MKHASFEGPAVRLWKEENEKRGIRYKRSTWVMLALALVLLTCNHAHGQGGAANALAHYGKGKTGQQAISDGLGMATAGWGLGAAVCGLSCAGGEGCMGCVVMGGGAAGLGLINGALNWQNLPDGPTPYGPPDITSVGGGGGGGGDNTHSGGGMIDQMVPDMSDGAKLTVRSFNPLQLPTINNRLHSTSQFLPRFDWRSTAVIAIQNNLLAPRFRHLPATLPVKRLR